VDGPVERGWLITRMGTRDVGARAAAAGDRYPFGNFASRLSGKMSLGRLEQRPVRHEKPGTPMKARVARMSSCVCVRSDTDPSWWLTTALAA